MALVAAALLLVTAWTLQSRWGEASARAAQTEQLLGNLHTESVRYQASLVHPIPSDLELDDLLMALAARKKEAEPQEKEAEALLRQIYPWSRTLRTIYAATPQGVRLQRLQWSGAQISLQGQANRRDEVLTYITRLQDSGLFDRVELSRTDTPPAATPTSAAPATPRPLAPTPVPASVTFSAVLTPKAVPGP